MNRRDRIGIAHAGTEEGTMCDLACGSLQETQDEIDCMACIERKVHMDNLRAALRDSVKRWRRDPLSIAWSPVPAVVEVLDNDIDESTVP
jgi:hypothetical protein